VYVFCCRRFDDRGHFNGLFGNMTMMTEDSDALLLLLLVQV
jgi:hypothetical protein